MLPETTYHMRAHADWAGGSWVDDDHTFTTGALPSSLTFPTMAVTRPSPSSSSPENPGIEMITIPSGKTPAFFTDRDGHVIWYYDVGASSFPYVFKLLPNGHMVVMITTSPVATSAISSIREIDLAGNVIRQLDIPTLQQKMHAAGFDFAPDNFTHDLLPLANGHLIVLVNYSVNFPNGVPPEYPTALDVVGDGLVDLDENWNPVWAWNSFDYLDVHRHLLGLPDWTHGNGVDYSPSDGNLFLSLRHQSWVLKIDYSNGTGTGTILWRLGYQGDIALTVNGLPSTDPSQWFSFQHFPVLVSQTGSQTTLAVWDNGDNRVQDTAGTTCGGTSNVACYSRANVFQIDDSGKVADLTFSHLPGLYSLWGGSVNQLSNGNVEFDANAPVELSGSGVASMVQEVTQTATPQVVWQMAITPNTANAYRAYRYPSLYNGITWQY
jgi:hypothetical protein